jgi:multiple sugar transport system ATP-binding protein
MPKLVFENISKTYSNGQNAVRNANLVIDESEFMVLVGPSGCGKSTMLRMVAGLEDITSGNLSYGDTKWNDLEPKKRKVGMVFQNYALYPHLTVAENLAFPLSVNKVKKDIIKSKVNEIADLIGLKDYLSRKPKHLSGGQRQRVALGRAIIRKPNLFLFDEPLSNLDAKLRVQMRNEIRKLHDKFKVSSIYVTHDQVEAMTMGTRLAVMNEGKIMQVDTPDKIYNDPANLFVAGFIGSPEMNFFKGNIENGFFIEDQSGIKFKTNFKDQNNIIAGIRPEEFSLNPSKKDDFIEVEVNSIENLGHESIIYFYTANELKKIRTSEKLNFAQNDKIKIHYNPNNIKYFDEKGDRLRL